MVVCGDGELKTPEAEQDVVHARDARRRFVTVVICVQMASYLTLPALSSSRWGMVHTARLCILQSRNFYLRELCHCFWHLMILWMIWRKARQRRRRWGWLLLFQSPKNKCYYIEVKLSFPTHIIHGFRDIQNILFGSLKLILWCTQCLSILTLFAFIDIPDAICSLA